jgi:hypothetical protein
MKGRFVVTEQGFNLTGGDVNSPFGQLLPQQRLRHLAMVMLVATRMCSYLGLWTTL